MYDEKLQKNDEIPVGNRVSHFSVTSDGSLLATSHRTSTTRTRYNEFMPLKKTERVINIWDTKTKKVIAEFKKFEVTCLSFNADGTKLAVGSNGQGISIYNVSEKKQEGETIQPKMEIHNFIHDMVFSSKGDYLLVSIMGQGYDRFAVAEVDADRSMTTVSGIRLYDLVKGGSATVHYGDVTQSIYFGSNGDIRYWNKKKKKADLQILK